ncbi:putative AC transposase [Bienertia sinuspersici]
MADQDQQILDSNEFGEKEKTVRGKKRTSAVWNHYDLITKTDGAWAVCKYCKHEMKAHGHVGTTNARRHTEKCDAYVKFVQTNPASNVVYDHDTYVRMFAESIIYHGYPLSMVEHIKTIDLHRYLNPYVKDISRYTITKYVMGEHERYKKIISDRLHSISSRICLTCDGWTACTSRAYFALTAHFIDNDWKLNAFVLNFRRFPPPHDGESIFQFVKSLLNEWDIEKKVFSITLDNASANDKMVEKLRKDVHSSSPLPLDGKYFHIRCAAHILNLIVQKGLQMIDASVKKLREVVRFIDSSDARLSAFDKAILDCGDRTSFRGKLVLDVTTRWNSTYNMIRRALDAKEAIDLFILRERELEMIFDEEWETIGNICDFLEPFYDITELFSGTQYPTSNSYLACVINIEKLLYDSHKDPSNAVRRMAKPMWEKFDKYWSEHSLILSFGLLLDPRYKMACLNDLYSSLYVPVAVEGKVNEIHSAFVALYECYAKNSQAHMVVQHSVSDSGPSNLNRPFKAKKILKNFNPHSCSSRTAKSDVDSYLNLPFVVDHDGFDILEYWKAQSVSYPTLALMARDILAIPITSVASESAFSAGGRILNKLRSSLLPKNVEILVTTRSWLFGFEPEENDEEVLSVAREATTDDVANE